MAIRIIGDDGSVHEFRFFSATAFRNILPVWQKLAPTDRLFCATHGAYEQIGKYDPTTIKSVIDRVESELFVCDAMCEEERQKIAADIERHKRRG